MDLYCDEQNNVEECEFDGGDCCNDESDFAYCDICMCFETGVTNLPTTDPQDCLVPDDWIGDGACDDDANTEVCDYDGGDCCLDPVEVTDCSICMCFETGVTGKPPVNGTEGIPENAIFKRVDSVQGNGRILVSNQFLHECMLDVKFDSTCSFNKIKHARLSKTKLARPSLIS
jgi:hypothetical protein